MPFIYLVPVVGWTSATLTSNKEGHKEVSYVLDGACWYRSIYFNALGESFRQYQ